MKHNNTWYISNLMTFSIISQPFSPMVSIRVHLEGSLAGGVVVAEQFLESDDTSDGERYLAGNEGLACDRCQGLQRHASYDADSREDTQQQVR